MSATEITMLIVIILGFVMLFWIVALAVYQGINSDNIDDSKNEKSISSFENMDKKVHQLQWPAIVMILIIILLIILLDT